MSPHAVRWSFSNTVQGASRSNNPGLILQRNPDILLVSAFRAPFIDDDIETLKKHARVRVCIGNGLFHAVRIVYCAFTADIIFCWFASVYAAIAVAAARLLGAKSVVIVGGVDVAREREFNYGIWLNPWKARFVRYALRRADRVLVVDLSLKQEAIERACYDGKNIHYAPTGFDTSFWKPLGMKQPQVLTVAAVDDRPRLHIKGIDTLLEAARVLPRVKFILIGVREELLRLFSVPENVIVYPKIGRSELLAYYREAKVYCQPSLREGLPNTLCEAMLCGCIPVGTSVGGNVTAIGETGFLVPPRHPHALAAALMEALQAPAEAGMWARARIVALFPREKREELLLETLRGLTDETGR